MCSPITILLIIKTASSLNSTKYIKLAITGGGRLTEIRSLIEFMAYIKTVWRGCCLFLSSHCTHKVPRHDKKPPLVVSPSHLRFIGRVILRKLGGSVLEFEESQLSLFAIGCRFISSEVVVEGPRFLVGSMQ